MQERAVNLFPTIRKKLSVGTLEEASAPAMVPTALAVDRSTELRKARNVESTPRAAKLLVTCYEIRSDTKLGYAVD